MLIIGITGTIGAGKGAIVDYLVSKKGFVHYSMRAFLITEIERRGLPINRDNMFIVANEFRKNYSPGYMVEQYLEKALKQNKNVIIESIRSVGEVQTLKKSPNAYLLAVDADIKIRYERIVKRKSATDFVSFEKFVEDEQKESTSEEPWVANLVKCKALADIQIINNGSIRELYDQVDTYLNNI